MIMYKLKHCISKIKSNSLTTVFPVIVSEFLNDVAYGFDKLILEMKINDNKGKNIVSNTLNIIMYWLKTLSQYNKNEIA